jgi:ATP-dependent exoDNAse (exonuclease V) beta subunit
MNEIQTPFVVYNASAGSGKTYTLVKNYLKILLNTNNPFKFQHILAMTFTNKAAAEMKTRVLETLHKFKNGDFDDSMFQDIKKELNLTEETLKKRSENIYKNILNQYGGFNITTIDSFTYKLVKSFAFDLGLSMNFEVEMNPVSLINEATDVLLSKIGIEKQISKTLINFAKEKANEDKDWKIEKEFQEIAKLLLKEDQVKHLNSLSDKSISDFENLNSELNKRIKYEEQKIEKIANQAFKIINSTSLKKEDFVRGGFNSFFNYLKTKQFDKININGTLDKNILKDHHQCSGKASAEAKAEMQTIKPKLIELYNKTKLWFETDYPKYVLDVLVKKSLIPLSVLKSIQQILNNIKADNNILFNSEFNQLISKHLSEQPAAFIYEKLGEKFRHYFIDEMQDTSILQWQNNIPLIKNALESENEKGERGSLLLVGDAKQCIYRWRASKPEQFIGLTQNENPFFVEKKTETLDTNFRSHTKIISFNNQFFQFISNYLQNTTYKELYFEGNKQKTNQKKGGYVEINLIDEVKTDEERDKIYPEKVLEIIQKLEGKFDKNEICILTRKRKQGIAIANHLSKNDIEIISSETLLLDNSPKVKFIMDMLRYIDKPQDQKSKFNVLNFIHNFFELPINIHDFFEDYINLNQTDFFNKLKEINILFDFNSFVNTPFYESIETIIRSFKLTNKSDAYLQFFLDVVIEFSQKNNSGLNEFITYWEDKKDKLSIVVPEGKDAVSIMTVHKSKGLEFPVVIFAYDLDIYKTLNTEKVWYPDLNEKEYGGFKTALINYNKSKLELVSNTGKRFVKEKTEALELDNFNLLYVALTRAKEQLYVVSEYKPPNKLRKTYPQKYGEFFYEFLKNNNEFKNNENCFVYGDIERKSKKELPKIYNEEQKEFLSSPWQEHQITIVANSSIDSVFDDARKYGNLLHEILSEIKLKNDVKNVVLKYVNKGIIPIEKEEHILQIIKNVVNHPKLSKYFSEDFQIYNEREIVTTNQEILIPDRVAIQNNKATIIDYKTGASEPKHRLQIDNYASVLQKMGYIIENKLLVYIQPNQVDVKNF